MAQDDNLTPNSSDDTSPTTSTNLFDKPYHTDTSNDDLIDSNASLLPQFKPTRKKWPSGGAAAAAINNADVDAVFSTQPSDFPMWRKHVAVAILFFINLLNYMDRYTIAGVLIPLQEHFNISNAMAGLLQTVFIISYMIIAPLFGYLGDRYNRKVIVAFGMIVWSGCTLLASFISDPNLFSVFLLLRGLVGVGEASYSTIAPTIIGDLFVGQKRTHMLSVFFFAIPIGSGLGYIIGSKMATAFGGWEWALRFTPALGVIAILVLLAFCPNPKRGASETTAMVDEKHSYMDDIRYLTQNKSFIFVTLGFTFMAFVVGSLTLWGPVFFAYSQVAIGALEPCVDSDCDYSNISFIFGAITCIAGFTGIAVGTEWARRWKLRGRKNADPIVCGLGLIFAAPFLLIGVHVPLLSVDASWVMIFFADVCLCLQWTLVGDMTLYVTEPARRSTANAVLILCSHLFGDAGSPYLVGEISDQLLASRPDTYMNKYLSLQQAMYVTLFVCVLGGGGFFAASLFVEKDKEKVDTFMKSSSSSSSSKTRTSDDSQVSIPLTEDTIVGNGSLNHSNCNGAKHNSYNSSTNNKCGGDAANHKNVSYICEGRETVI